MTTAPPPRIMADVTPSGWVSVDEVGDDNALVTYADGSVRFRHVCDRGQRGVIICAPLLQLGGGHTLTRAGASPTVSPSILCDDCGTHGFVTDGVWRSC